LDDLHIYAHRSLKQILNQFLGQFYIKLGFNLIYHVLDEENYSLIYEDKTLEVYSFPLKHRILCNGFLFKEKPKLRNLRKDVIELYNIPVRERVNIKNGADFVTEDGTVIPNERLTLNPPKSKSYAYLTDTSYLPSVADYIQGVDLLYHESTFLDEDAELAMETGHSSATQAAQIAALACASKLVLGHFSTRYRDLNIFKTQAQSTFDNVELAEDGIVFEI
jgi:ribonuclease Z